MKAISESFGRGVGEFWKAFAYSVEHMTVTQWAILGTATVVVGFMLLRTQRF